MRFLGIDYGTKRVGIALSDENGTMAFPEAVLPNDAALLGAVAKICREKLVGAIIVGESKNLNGEPNQLMKRITPFKNELGRETGLPVYLEPEFFTSAEALRIQGKSDTLDASAAALILKSYLDKTRNTKSETLNKLEIQNSKGKTAGGKISFDDFQKIELSVGQILSAEKVPATDKLLRLSVSFGDDKPRQIISGIAHSFPDPSALVGKKFLFVTNLAPRIIKGLESDGMILALVSGEETLSLIAPAGDVPPGAKAR